MNPYYPLMGPKRTANAQPLIDRAEVEECRRILYPTVRGADPDWISAVELFGTADELAFARDVELWGERPFDLED